MNSGKKVASVNIDVDTICTVLSAYGKNPGKCENITFSKIIPRMLSLFIEKDVHATFFVIGKYAEKKENKQVMQELISQGHEIANHTYSHKPNFSRLSFEEKKSEILSARDAIKSATGFSPVGFRAPGWDADSETLSILQKNNFLYDSSVLPSPFMSFIPKVMNLFNSGKTPWESTGMKEYSRAPLEPYHPSEKRLWEKGDMRLMEMPVSTFSPMKAPFYATPFFVSSPALFPLAYALRNSSSYLNFQLHTIDLFDQLSDSNTDFSETIKHPSMRYNITQKKNFFASALSKIKNDYEIITLAEIAKLKQ